MSVDYELEIAVCDDNARDLIQIVEMTNDILQDRNISCRISSYTNSCELLDAIRSGDRFHILLLDVMMGEMDGMELAAELRAHGDRSAIIFISASCEMALCGYEVGAARYLSKPLSESKLREALLYCYRLIREKREILLQTENGLRRVFFEELQYVEAFDRGTRFILEEETLLSKMRLADVERLLPTEMFIFCHRAYLVNLAWTKQIRPFEFEMKSGLIVPIGRPRYTQVYKNFWKYIMD